MALPSQSSRTGSGRVAMASQARRQLRPILIGLVAIGACVAGYFAATGLWSAPAPQASAPGATPVNDTQSPPSPTVAPTSALDGIAASQANPSASPPMVTGEAALPPSSEPAPAPAGPDVFTISMSRDKGEAGEATRNPTASRSATPGEAPSSVQRPDEAASQTPAPVQGNPASGGAPATPSVSEPQEPTLGREFDGTPDELMGLVTEGYSAKGRGDLVAARQQLSEVLADERVPGPAAASLRATISSINDELIFSPRAFANDPYSKLYEFKSGDRLSRLPAQQNLAADWRLITRVNRISNPDRMSLGQKLKLVTGPFHAVVHKSAFRMDLYLGPAEPASQRVFVRSVKIGLGDPAISTTPEGEFVIRKNSKLVNPTWVNPKTGERFGADDPKNPIGERWLGLEGLGDAAAFVGFGIHGTIDPASVGQQRSMGCVRLLQEDVELVYELLTEGVSHVTIRP